MSGPGSSVQPANVHTIGESLGIRVKEDAAQALAPDVEYRLREIIQVQLRAGSLGGPLRWCGAHGSSGKWVPTTGKAPSLPDPRAARPPRAPLRQEGAKFMLHAKRSYLTTEDVNCALRLRTVEVGGAPRGPARILRRVRGGSRAAALARGVTRRAGRARLAGRPAHSIT